MTTKSHHLLPADLRGLARLAVAATTGITDMVEAMHHGIARPLGLHSRAPFDRTAGLTGLVFRSIRGVTRLVGSSLDGALARLEPLFGPGHASTQHDAVLAALNGILGDYLDAHKNPLAITMQLRHAGRSLPLDRSALAAALPLAGTKPLLLIHGLCMNDGQWLRGGHDHGASLARDLGYTPVYLHYNSGLHISDNGRALADLLETLIECWPVRVERLTIVAHSMGGLLARSACHYAGGAKHRWLDQLDKVVFLGTPHHGAPLERGGNWLDSLLVSNRYSAPFARLGRIRSAGITDLRHGNLLETDWRGRDRFQRAADPRLPVALPKKVRCFAIAATQARRRGDVSDRLLGDGLVPLRSALGQHDDATRELSLPTSRQWIAYTTHHLELLESAAVYAKIKHWLGG